MKKGKEAEPAMKNKLADLNDHLFAQLERLSDEELTGDKLTDELTRSKGICDIAKNIIEGGKLVLDAHVQIRDGLRPTNIPQLIGHVEEEEKAFLLSIQPCLKCPITNRCFKNFNFYLCR